jgi:hypothetical protein
MDFKTKYPDFAAVEEHVRRARAERSVAIAHMLIDVWESTHRGLLRLARALSSGFDAERDRRAVEADAFVKRWVTKP